jgi:hypothetical protein
VGAVGDDDGTGDDVTRATTGCGTIGSGAFVVGVVVTGVGAAPRPDRADSFDGAAASGASHSLPVAGPVPAAPNVA